MLVEVGTWQVLNEKSGKATLQYNKRCRLKVSYHGIQRWAKSRALGCEKFMVGSARMLLCKTGPPYSPSLYSADG